MRHGSTKAVYYKVVSGNGKYSGYIWRGFLTSGKYQYIIDTDDEPDQRDQTEYYYDPMDYNYGVAKKNIDTNLNKQISALFIGAKPDNQVQLAADLTGGMNLSDKRVPLNVLSDIQNDILGADNSNDVLRITSYIKDTDKPADLLQFEKEQIVKQLNAKGKSLSDFANYKIGSYVYPNNDKNYGKFLIYLVPKDATLPTLSNVYFDPVNTSISVSNALIDNQLSKQIADLFPGTIQDDQVQLAANLASVDLFVPDSTRIRNLTLDHIIGQKDPENYCYENAAKYKGTPEDFIKFEKNTWASMLAIRHKTFSDFKGYKIGVYVLPQNNNDIAKYLYGQSIVVLVPPKTKLPILPVNHTFNPNTVDLIN